MSRLAYFVRRTFRSDRPGMYGWETIDVSCADEAAGRASLEQPAPRGTISRTLFSFDGRRLVSLAKVRP